MTRCTDDPSLSSRRACVAEGTRLCPKSVQSRVTNCSTRSKPLACVSPVSAYDALAPYYSSILETRKEYLHTVEEIVASHARDLGSLLDIGSGNGVRALRIATTAKIESVVLVEPSEEMRRQSPESSAVWRRSATEIPETAKFDLITCLWNVLGHLDGTEERLSMLSQMRNFLSPSGMLFLDVNHRYNAGAYGWPRTASRIIYDFFFPSEKNGDVVASWQVGQQQICTRGHVFTHRELVRLFELAGLRIKARWVIDYGTGIERRFALRGHLLYQLTA
jgi:SAM-dependent methyltransferase